MISQELIRKKIYLIRGLKVMLDNDLAKLYEIETKQLTRQVRRNLRRFPGDFMFQLTKDEFLRCQIGTSKKGGRRYLPYVFTEQGVAMLSSILNNKRAIQVNIGIMRVFVKIRKMAYVDRELLTYKPADKPQQYINTTMMNKLDQLSGVVKAQDIIIKQAINKSVLPTGTQLISPEKQFSLTRLSDNIANLIVDINEIKTSKNDSKIFNVTPKTLKASHDLHKLVKSRNDLNEFIDALYFIIFEGSKQAKNIPKKRMAEFLDPANRKNFKDDFVVIEIKNLRGGCRHDPDFNSKAEVIVRKISNICKKYVNKDSIPEFKQSDYFIFQERILKEIVRFLLKLKDAISI